MATIRINTDAEALLNDIDLSNLFAVPYSRNQQGVGQFTLPLKGEGTITLLVYGESLPSSLFDWLIPGQGTVSRVEFKNTAGSLLFSVALPPGNSVRQANFAQAFISGNAQSAVNLFLIGNDTVQSSIDVTIEPFPQIENIILANPALVAFGNQKNNRLTGNNLSNLLVGNQGADRLTGKGGADTFALGARSSNLNATTRDVITDFRPSQGDEIQISRSLYAMPETTQLTFRAFRSTAFQDLLNGAAATSSRRFVYNLDTGILYYNANGSSRGFGNNGGDLVELLPVGGAIPQLSSTNISNLLDLVA